MLSARASAELARALFADVIGGLAATEELEDGVPEEDAAREITGAAATDVRTPHRTSRRRRRPAPAAVAASSGGGDAAGPSPNALPPLPGEEHTSSMSDAQRRRMMALFRDRNISDRKARLEYASKIVGRDLSSSKDLTADEAAHVIGDLESWDPDAGAGAAGEDDVVDGEVVDEEPSAEPEGGDA
jgi:hypothetical protein